MKRKLLFFVLTFCFFNAWAQIPKLYIQIVSHNEPTDNLDAAPGINYFRAKNRALQLAAIVDSKNAKWNLQTSDGFLMGAINYDAAFTSGTDIFETLANPPYNDNIEIDPRSKNSNGRNIADQWLLLDSIGANPSTTVGGFLWYICQPSTLQPDWWRYQDTITGQVYGNKVKFNLLSGAGSAGAILHCNDLNDFGIFKPDTTTNFYQHNPARNLWCVGTGCAPLLDSLSDEQAIIDLIQGQVDSIQSGIWPSDKFYVTRIMTNQREYGPMFFQKISRVIDSLNLIPSTQLHWATISETFDAFQNWQITAGLDYSQWLCGQTPLQIQERGVSLPYSLYPNPLGSVLDIEPKDQEIHLFEIRNGLGCLLLQKEIIGKSRLDLSTLVPGIYLVSVDGFVQKLIKE